MKTSHKRIVSTAVATLIVAGSIGIWSVGSSAAGATMPYTSQLTAAQETAKFTVAKTSRTQLARTAAKRRVAIKTATAAPRITVAAAATGGSDLSRAKSALARLKARHPILRGTTVEIGNARGYQAISFYRSGRIIISPTHKASIERIMNHEVWHIIDWRDNNSIDWGERVPPR